MVKEHKPLYLLHIFAEQQEAKKVINRSVSLQLSLSL